MKVPDSLLFSIFIQQDEKLRERISRKVTEISTGKRIINLSDDPVATFNVISLKKDIAHLSQFSKNRLFADVNLTYIDFTLGKMADKVKEIYTKVVQAKNEINTTEALRSVGTELRESLEFLLNRANDKVGKNFIFSGSALETKPFDENFNYLGSAEVFNVQIEEGNFTRVFKPGSEVFGTNLYQLDTLYPSPQSNFGASGTLQVSYDSTTVSADYGDGIWYLAVKVSDPDVPLSAYGVEGDLKLDGNTVITNIGSLSLNGLISAINSNPDFNLANVSASLVSNPDGTYTMRLSDADVPPDNTVSDTGGNILESNNLENFERIFNTLSPVDLRAYVHQVPDGRYTLRLIPEDLSVNLSINFLGTALGSFYTPNLFQVIDEVTSKLENGLSPDESDLAGVNLAYDKLTAERSETGSILSQVKAQESVQENRMDVLKKQKSDNEDVELSESIMEYTRYRTAYDALMRIIADTRDMTILRYL
jgi:flagellar hook-associated protein 3 FlgL